MKTTVFFGQLFLFIFLTTGFVRIGNNGDVVFENGQYYLLDLHEASIHENPYFGDKISSALENRWEANWPNESRNNSFIPEKEFLLRKLTDIEKVVPGLGFLILENLRTYDLEFDEKVANQKNEKGFQRVAFRQRGSISVVPKIWEKMNAPNRAALLIHEMVDSLGRTECVDQGQCDQHPALIRSLVAQLFMSQPPANLRRSLFSLLSIESLGSWCKKPSIELNFSLWKKEGPACSSETCTLLDSEQKQYRIWDETLKNDFGKFCSRADKIKPNNSMSSVSVEITFVQGRSFFDPYTIDGKDPVDPSRTTGPVAPGVKVVAPQASASFMEITSRQTLVIDFKDAATCEARLYDKFMGFGLQTYGQMPFPAYEVCGEQ